MVRLAKRWEQLVNLRKAAGISQYELARRVKISRSALGNYEQGEREPDFETTRKLADYFGVSVDHLLGHKATGSVQLVTATELGEEWRKAFEIAQAEGYSPEQVLRAIRLLDVIRREQEQQRKD